MLKPSGTQLPVRTVRMEDPRPSQQSAKREEAPTLSSRSTKNMTLVIDDNVPLSGPIRNPMAAELRELLPQLRVGQSIGVPNLSVSTVSAIAKEVRKRLQHRHRTRKTVESGKPLVRIWRTA